MFDLESYIQKNFFKIAVSGAGVTFLSIFIAMLFIGSLLASNSNSEVEDSVDVNGDSVYEAGVKKYNQEPTYMTSVLNIQKSIYDETGIIYSMYDILYADILIKGNNAYENLPLSFGLDEAISCSERLSSDSYCFENPKYESKWRKEHNIQLQVIEYGIENPFDNEVVITAGFGKYDQTDDGTLEDHHGVDLVGITDKTINSPSKPTTVNAEHDGCVNDTSLTSCGLMQLGNAVILEYDNPIEIDGKKHKIYSQYGHLESNNVSTGDKLPNRTKVGSEGSTGLSTGSHLHLTYGGYENGTKYYVDPFLFLIPKAN